MLNKISAFVLMFCFLSLPIQAKETIRLITHNSFGFSKQLFQAFELKHDVEIKIIKLGDAGEMVNKLILTKNNPIADVVFGIDNMLLGKAEKYNLLSKIPNEYSEVTNKYSSNLKGLLVAVDYGYVALNVDNSFFKNKKLPENLWDLSKPKFNNLSVVQHPATSSPGLAFLLATIAHFGENKAFDWWQAMRINGLKISKGWSEAYYQDFSHNGGNKPIVVSYITSPAAEIFYAKVKQNSPPTANLTVAGSTFLQIEGVGLINQANVSNSKIDKLLMLITLFTSTDFQTQLQRNMWMFPANESVKIIPELSGFDLPETNELNADEIVKNTDRWIKRWINEVLR